MAASPPRSAGITALAWVVILASAGLTLISFVTLLMIMAGSHGTSSTTVLGFLSVVVAPPVTVIAGIGLLRRRSWARYYLLALFGVILAYNVYAFARANPEPIHYVSPQGVPTTVLPTDRSMFVPIIVACTGMLAVMLSRRARIECTQTAASATTAAEPAPPSSSPQAPGVVVPSARYDRAHYDGRDSRARQNVAVVVVVVLLLALAAGMGWLGYDGIATGETTLPTKSASQRRSVLRLEEPAMFWASIGIYSFIALGAVGLIGWGAVQAHRSPRVKDWEG